MFARVSIFEDVDVELQPETYEWIRTEGRRLQRELPGYEGVLTLTDADGRPVVRVNLHDTEEHARQADAILSGEPPA